MVFVVVVDPLYHYHYCDDLCNMDDKMGRVVFVVVVVDPSYYYCCNDLFNVDDEMGRIRRVESKWSPRFALWLSRLRWLPGVDCDRLCNGDEDFDDPLLW